MYYEINVSLNGKHFFATHERSIDSKSQLEKVYKVFKEKFPVSEGYQLSVTHWRTAGEIIDMDDEAQEENL